MVVDRLGEYTVVKIDDLVNGAIGEPRELEPSQGIVPYDGCRALNENRRADVRRRRLFL
jgi:hypothetical protein